MEHITVTVTTVNNFAWFESRTDALKRAKTLTENGYKVYVAGKRAKNKMTYIEIRVAAIYQNKWSGSGMPWVVAWKEQEC